MAKDGLSGLLYRRLVGATLNSGRGLRQAILTEEAFQVYVFLSVLLVPLALVIATDYVQLILMFGTIFLVLITELLNTAVESVVDRVGLDLHELSGRAKDMGSAAVSLSILLFFVVWGIVLAENF
jgi:diacylglycerol kinase (ATP)|tara:strand:+ start:2792 stop:3166 length:375 start_codon:yes stop_codon:yes gene_type:complete